MKKTAFIALISLICLSAKAQIKDTIGLNLPVVNGSIIYEGVIVAPNATQNDLYQNAQQWFADSFKSAKDVVQVQDKNSGIIIGNGILNFETSGFAGLGMTTEQHDKLTIKIVCKDGKYKYSIYNQALYVRSDIKESIYDLILYTRNGGNDNPSSYNDMYGKLVGTSKVPESKGTIKEILKKSDIEVRKMIESIKTAMAKTADIF